MVVALYLLGPTQDCVLHFKRNVLKRSVIPTCFTVFA